MRTRGVFVSDVRPLFTKPALSVDDHILLLAERGLRILDRDRAAHYITVIGYYRLSGYIRYYRTSPDSEILMDETTFDQILSVYVFDRKLRGLLSDALERIEVAVKAILSDSGAHADSPFWMCNAANFDHGVHDQVLAEIKDAIGSNKEKHHHLFLSHFFTKYCDPLPPCWMLMETLSFGQISRIYKRSKGHIRKPTAFAFCLQQDILESWLHSLVFVRNLCAHHSRVWNRGLTIRPKIPKQYAGAIPETSHARLYSVCCILQHMMAIIADGSQWADRLRTLINERPSIPLNSMGFPEDWEKLPPWIGNLT